MQESYTEMEWRDLWLRQAKTNDVPAIPILPPETVQARLHGTTGYDAVNGALRFRDVVKSKIEIGNDWNYLDFGCGYGRHIRVFLKDFGPKNIIAVDIDSTNIELVRKHLPDVAAIQSVEQSALGLESTSVDLIVSFSVFSHINEASARFWINELSRVLSNRGVMVLTSWGRSIFEIFKRIDDTGEVRYAWEKNIERAFPARDAVRRAYEDGKFVFGRHGNPGGELDADTYGISLMPRRWIENNSNLRVIDVIDDPALVPQTTFFLRKASE